MRTRVSSLSTTIITKCDQFPVRCRSFRSLCRSLCCWWRQRAWERFWVAKTTRSSNQNRRKQRIPTFWIVFANAPLRVKVFANHRRNVMFAIGIATRITKTPSSFVRMVYNRECNRMNWLPQNTTAQNFAFTSSLNTSNNKAFQFEGTIVKRLPKVVA